jgi:hypothetical protein
MITIIMLMHTVSLKFQLSACVAIHNQCSNTKLVSPIYFGNGVIHPKLSDQQIDIGTKMRARFEINATQDDFEGALLFKLQRKKRGGNRFSIYLSDLFKLEEYSDEEVKCIQMLIAWKMKDSKLSLHIALVEHSKKFTWNEDELKQLYYKNRSWLKGYNDTRSDTWIVDDTILKTTFNVRDLKGIPGLSISISEEEINDGAMRPLCVDLER